MTEAFSIRRKGRFPRLRGSTTLLLGIGLLCLFAIALLVSEIVEEMRFLNSASSDNVHWVLSQAEVEFLEFSNAVETARRNESTSARDTVIVEFDVFYSRMMTLGTGMLYADLREIDAFGQSVSDIRQKLDAMVPLIDGAPAELQAGLPILAEEATEIRPLLRTVATTGLQFFAESSDQSRMSVANTLLRLAAITVVLVLALVVVLAYNRHVSKQTERSGEELADAYTRLNTILETSLDAVIVSDLKGRILTFNTAAERIFQHSADAVIGRNLGDIIIPDHLRSAHEAGMKRMRETGEHAVVGHGRVRLEAKRSNGEVFPVEMALEKAQTGEDEVVVGFLRDISRLVSSETELVEARDRALAGEKAKAEFLAMMTHEIRTPLNGLLGNLSLLEKTPLSSTQSRYVRNMDISGGVLMHHVDAVLDVARFEAGADVSREEAVHVGRLIQDIVNSQASAAEANGNHIQWGWIGEPLDWVEIDAARLQQVLLNLVGNAIKFTRNGRILIEAEQSVGAPRDGDMSGLDIRVIDSGIGISEADQDRVFNDFQTIEAANIEGQTGTGLGLGIARRFIEAMGGEIGCESTLGEGSVFWLHVPVVSVEGPDARDDTETEIAAVAACDVLLVEDNEINLELAQAMLSGLGHRVSVARDGEEAVKISEGHRFDLILMDIRMPRLDGLGATRAIRSGEGACRDVPIIAFSANVLPDAKARFTDAGMSGFLPKPFSRGDLQHAIARHCASSRQPKSVSTAQASPMDRLLDRYRAESIELFDWLATAPSEMHEIAERAHKIAGSAAAFGQPELRDALVAVEIAAEEGASAGLDAAIKTAREAWEAAPAPSLG